MAPPRQHSQKSFTNRVKKTNIQTNADRVLPKGHTHLRSKATIKRLAMYSEGANYSRDGKFLGGAYMSKDTSHSTRIAPDQRYFGNTNSISQEQLETFREEMAATIHNPYKVLLHANKLPMGLLKDSTKKTQMNLLTTETFETTFGPKKQRKRPNLSSVVDLESMLNKISEQAYDPSKDTNIKIEADMREARREDIFEKGTSKRIWGELYKVIDSSDVLIQVLDARDPMGTRSSHLENQLKKNARHKHLIFVLNKCDLVPTWCTARWVKILSQEYPTLAFHASLQHPFGKGSLIQLLRQFARLHPEKKQISVGFVGYPNVGKSSIINTLKAKKVCRAAPIPGETKVWQYITLTKRIYLIDCPGVVPTTGDTEGELVLKGVVRVENLVDATEYIPELLKRIKKEYLVKTYAIASWTDHEDFLTQMAERTGKLQKGNKPNLNAVAKIMLYDYQKGRIPYFTAPPMMDGTPAIFSMNTKGVKTETEVKVEDVDAVAETTDVDAVATTATAIAVPAADATPIKREKKKIEFKNLVVHQKLKNINVKAEFDEEDAKGDGYVDPFDEEPDWDDLYQNDENISDDEEVVNDDNEAVQDDDEDDVAQLLDDIDSDDSDFDYNDFDEDLAAGDLGSDEEEEEESEEEQPKKKNNKKNNKRKVDEEEQVSTKQNNKKKSKSKQVEEEEQVDSEDELVVVKKSKKKEMPEKGLVLLSNVAKLKQQKPTNNKVVPRKEYQEKITEVESDDDGAVSQKKEKRMKTNKGKVGNHFYETHNVKNKNRNRKIPRRDDRGKKTGSAGGAKKN
ncbi:Putative GTP-binding protein [Cavenderia fasciculata]|uniref:Nucleolar GTP-binding protein 2 n=1 Tax=Cavenderia fasciculata TaxID=261658 RepID=F4Q153_CACFS|nr:Putative GTP-binding protein [Cavenderia fasciculata]EGG18554.1 Putative GTP-binding protein [Cavenderia fasciculata]|eukprot:XP_004366458.1 Putative GTP-binding protein [Cavenderia fasciculata]